MERKLLPSRVSRPGDLNSVMQRATIAALRCFYVARSYLAASKAVEAMGLFQRTTERVAQAEQAWDDLEHPDAHALKDLQALKEQAVVSHCTLPAFCTSGSAPVCGLEAFGAVRMLLLVMACWAIRQCCCVCMRVA